MLMLDGGGFDGIIVRTRAGRRFVDAPEVRRISRGVVVLGITTADVENPPPGARRVEGAPMARHDRTDATEADRDQVVDSLKRAFVEDRLDSEQLGDRVAIAHQAETLDELDAALAGLDG